MLTQEDINKDVATSSYPNHANLDTAITIDGLYKHNWHIGSHTKYRNKYMNEYIFKTHQNTDIIDLPKAKVILEKTLSYLRASIAKGKRVLFVGTNSYSSKSVTEYADRCGQYYIAKKWFGGLLTNWQTFSESIKRMSELDKMIQEESLEYMTKKERLNSIRKVAKHNSFMRGVKDMESVPNIIVIASPREKTAIREAKKMRNLPLTSILFADSDTDPSGINIVVPGNTSSVKAVNYFCQLCSNACLQGLIDEEKLSIEKEAIAAQMNNKDEKQMNDFPEKLQENDNTSQPEQ